MQRTIFYNLNSKSITNAKKFWMNVKLLFKSSHKRYAIKKDVLRNFAKFTGKHLCQSLFFNEVAGLRPETLSKKKLW